MWPPILERVKHFLNSNIYIAMDINTAVLNVISNRGSTLFSVSVNLCGSYTLGYISQCSAPENYFCSKETEEEKWIEVKIK